VLRLLAVLPGAGSDSVALSAATGIAIAPRLGVTRRWLPNRAASPRCMTPCRRAVCCFELAQRRPNLGRPAIAAFKRMLARSESSGCRVRPQAEEAAATGEARDDRGGLEQA
jgi:hypothetical protein